MKDFLYRGFLIQRIFYTEDFLYRGFFIQRIFIQRIFYTEDFLYRGFFIQKIFYTEDFLYRGFFLQRIFSMRVDVPPIFPTLDGSKAPLLLNDSSIPDPAAVILCDDTEIPGRHEVIRRAKVKGVFLAESIVEPNVSLAEKGILVAQAFVSPNHQTVPVQIINPCEDTIKLYGGTNIGHLEHVAMDDPVLFDNQKPTVQNLVLI